MKLDKYRGVIPAFYACYDGDGAVSRDAARRLTRYFVEQGVKGVYVGGSSGECIYQSVEDRKKTLEAVMEEGAGRLTVIAHVACNNTKDSQELAAHAAKLGVDAIAAIPPIFFKLPEYSVAGYWNDISAAAPDTDFIIYNIPQLAGTALTMSLLKTMLLNPQVAGVKNSSMPVQDIQMFKAEAMGTRDDFIVFNGPDEQLVSGLAMGADAVAIASAALIAAACQQYRICGTGMCPVGVATQDGNLRRRLPEEAAPMRVANFLHVSLDEIKTFARITGHDDIHDMDVDDLCTINREISEFTNISHA